MSGSKVGEGRGELYSDREDLEALRAMEKEAAGAGGPVMAAMPLHVDDHERCDDCYTASKGTGRGKG